MWVRILSEWPGSPRCGSVADVLDNVASAHIQAGHAERAPSPVMPRAEPSVPTPAVEHEPVPEPETAMVHPGERAVKAKGKARKR